MELVLIWLGCGVVSALIASGKGRSGAGFFLLGVLLGPLGLLGAGVASPDQAVKTDRRTRIGLETGELRRCPHCDEAIRRAARICTHCRHEVPPAPKRDWLGRDIR